MEWRMEDGGWRMEDGGWTMDDGRWKEHPSWRAKLVLILSKGRTVRGATGWAQLSKLGDRGSRIADRGPMIALSWSHG